MLLDFSSLLKEWGVTLSFLVVAATALTLLLFLGFREFALWFFQIRHLSLKQKEILSRLDGIDDQLRKLPIKSTSVQFPMVDNHEKSSQFTLDT